MSNIIDSTRVSMGWDNPWQTRRIDQIRRICIHHSATATGSRQAFENWWRTQHGWRNGGYSEIIHQNGDIEICYVPTIVTNGVVGHNLDTYHICAVGNWRVGGAQPSKLQMRSLMERIRFNMNRFNIPASRVLGHNEFSGHHANTCPGLNMNTLRSNLGSAISPPTSSTSIERFTVTKATGGFMNAADARNNRNQRTIVQPGTYYVFRRADGMINVTLTRSAPGSWINPATQGHTIRVGDRVRINNNATHWAVGGAISSWARGSTFTVQQVGRHGNNNHILLREPYSWIHINDIKIV